MVHVYGPKEVGPLKADEANCTASEPWKGGKALVVFHCEAKFGERWGCPVCGAHESDGSIAVVKALDA